MSCCTNIISVGFVGGGGVLCPFGASCALNLFEIGIIGDIYWSTHGTDSWDIYAAWDAPRGLSRSISHSLAWKVQRVRSIRAKANLWKMEGWTKCTVIPKKRTIPCPGIAEGKPDYIVSV